VSARAAAAGSRLRAARAEHGIGPVIAHSSYLINLASPDDALWRKSVEAFVFELLWANSLELPCVVLHPGAYTTSCEKAGLRRVIRALNEVYRRTPGVETCCLLENTAGQGTCLGGPFEHLATILAGVAHPQRLGVCLDTCHAFAAGYPLQTRADYLQTMRLLDQAVGLDRVKAIHLNDSKRELGSRVDRHEQIGLGQLGTESFAHLLNDRRLRHIPMYLETPKGDEPQTGKPWDQVNLERLRALVT
jgi:deoxyribonuclease-4